MSDHIKIREFDKSDFIQIVPLLDKVYSGWPKITINQSNFEYYKWKYLDIYQDYNKHVVAEQDGKIIGVSHNYHHNLKFFDSIVSACTMSDLAVDPEYREMGVWSNMVQHWNEHIRPEQDLHMTQYLTGNPIVIQRLEKIRESLPHTLTNLVWINDVDLHLKKIPRDNNLVVKTGYNTLRVLNTIQNSLRQQKKTSLNLSVEQITFCDNELQDFWDKISNNYDFITQRDPTYLNWRYVDPRSGNFTFKASRDDEGKITGYIVYTINDRIPGYPVGFICGLLTEPNSPETFNVLFNDAMNFFLENDVNIVNYLLVKNHPYSKLASSFGFLDSRVKLHIFISVYKEKELFKRIKDSPPERIHFSWGDHDSLPLGVQRTSG